MKYISMADFMFVPMLEGFKLESSTGVSAAICLVNDRKELRLEFYLLQNELPTGESVSRYNWCHEWLVNYLREVVGPPYTSNLAKVSSATWVGWQAVTSIGDGRFIGTRCIAAIAMVAAVRISFPIKRDPSVAEIAEILENVVFEDISRKHRDA